jgi:hypothetical protein
VGGTDNYGTEEIGMNSDQRYGTYLAQTGRSSMTPRQRRRWAKKDWRAVCGVLTEPFVPAE